MTNWQPMEASIPSAEIQRWWMTLVEHSVRQGRSVDMAVICADDAHNRMRTKFDPSPIVLTDSRHD